MTEGWPGEPFAARDGLIRVALQEHLLELRAYDRPTFVLMRGHPGRIHREFAVALPRPRSRTAPRFLAWKEEVLRELRITAATGRSAIAAPLLRAAM